MIKYLGKVNNQDISIPKNVYTVYDPLKNIEVVDILSIFLREKIIHFSLMLFLYLLHNRISIYFPSLAPLF